MEIAFTLSDTSTVTGTKQTKISTLVSFITKSIIFLLFSPGGCIPCTKVRGSPAWSCTSVGVMAYYCSNLGVTAYYCSYLGVTMSDVAAHIFVLIQKYINCL